MHLLATNLAKLPREVLSKFAAQALAEDVGQGDVTSQSIVPANLHFTAAVRARQDLVVSGLGVAQAVFDAVSPSIVMTLRATDGQRVNKGDTLMELAGPARALLTAERTALNILQRLSGIATLTSKYVEAIRETKARILDTRKTTPGLRLFEKYAVRCGGGMNHRFGLYDMVLIKDNHLSALKSESANAVALAIDRARATYPTLRVEVEADTLDQVRQAVEAAPDIILLDNMSLADLRAAVRICDGKIETEASGGVTLTTVKGIAETGVNFISVGALTHSAQAVDIALDFDS